MKSILLLTLISLKITLSPGQGDYSLLFDFEQAYETSSGQILIAGFSQSDTSARQLSLALYNSNDSLLWFRTYPDTDHIHSVCRISEDRDRYTLFFNADGYAQSIRCDKVNGALCDPPGILSSGYLLDVAVSGNSEYMLIQRSDSILVSKPGTDPSYSRPVSAGGVDNPAGRLTIYPTGDIFFTVGSVFGILDHELHPKKVWEFNKLKVEQSVYILPGHLILLSGSEESELFGPQNQQGYLALINAKNYDEVLWTRQFGSENEDENIPLIALPSQNSLGVLLKSQSQQEWYTLDLNGKKRKQETLLNLSTGEELLQSHWGKDGKTLILFVKNDFNKVRIKRFSFEL